VRILSIRKGVTVEDGKDAEGLYRIGLDRGDLSGESGASEKVLSVNE
jgi:hypothetical protein